MLFAYAFVSFLFFKIFPEFSMPAGNTVIGSVLMAITSAASLFAAELLAIRSYLFWAEKRTAGLTRDHSPPGMVFWFAAGVAVSAVIGFLVVVGFSPRMASSYKREPAMFWAMLVIPPTVYSVQQFVRYRSEVARVRREAMSGVVEGRPMGRDR